MPRKDYAPLSMSTLQALYSLFMDVCKFRPLHWLCAFLFMLFRNISAGASLLLILPLLQVIGFATGHDDTGGLVKAITTVFHYLHIPLNLLTILVSYIIVVSMIAFAAYAEQIISKEIQEQYIHHLRTQLYQQLLHTQWPFFIKQTRSHVLHTLTTQIQSINASNIQLMTLLNGILLLCAYTTLAFFLSWKMTLVAVFCALILLSMMRPLHRLTSLSGHDHVKRNQAIFQSITEQLDALKMIKSAGHEDKFSTIAQRISLSLESQNQHLTYVTATTKLLYSIGAVLIFSTLLYIAIKVLALPLSSLLLLLVVFSRLLPMVSTTQQTYQRLLHQIPAYRDVKHLLHESAMNQENLSQVTPDSPLFNDEISLTNVYYSYQKDAQPIISNCSIRIKKNTTTIITGPSGAGKSTLADLIVGLLEPTTGTIHIDQQPLNTSNTLAWRQSVAYVTQSAFLFNASIRENLQLFCDKLGDESLWQALEAAAAAEFVARLDNGLDTIVGDHGVRLSGGECQRIALARALLSKPTLLILDESTSALDSDNILKIQGALTHLRGKMTILIVSHQMEMRQFADQHITVNKGMVHVRQHTRKKEYIHRSNQQESVVII